MLHRGGKEVLQRCNRPESTDKVQAIHKYGMGMSVRNSIEDVQWRTFVEFDEAKRQTQGYFTLAELVSELGISAQTARQYMHKLAKLGDWEPAIRKIQLSASQIRAANEGQTNIELLPCLVKPQSDLSRLRTRFSAVC